jgi:hypothetical protein
MRVQRDECDMNIPGKRRHKWRGRNGGLLQRRKICMDFAAPANIADVDRVPNGERPSAPEASRFDPMPRAGYQARRALLQTIGIPSVPIPKFALLRGTLVCELRNPGTLATC